MTGTWTKGVQDDSTAVTNVQLAGLGNGIVGFAKIVQTITPTAVAAATTVEQSVTVPGLVVGDYVEVCPPALTAGVTLANSRVSAANTLQLQFVNSTAGSLTPPAGAHIIFVLR